MLALRTEPVRTRGGRLHGNREEPVSPVTAPKTQTAPPSRAHAQRHARHRGLSDRRWVTRLPLHLLHGHRRLSTPPSLCPAEPPRVPAEAHLLFQENVTVNAAKVMK